MDIRRHEVWRDGEQVEVTAAEFKILGCLCAEPGKVFTRQQLIDRAFGFGHYVLERTVDVHVGNLRRKLEYRGRRPGAR